MKLKNKLNGEIRYCKEYKIDKEISGVNYCITYGDADFKSRPLLVNMEFWKPSNGKN